jgi:DMSO reductase anchor subunit
MAVQGDINWHYRRRTVFLSLIVCAGLAAYAIHKDAATTAAAFPPLALLAGSIIGSYVFGAAWERVNGVGGNTEKGQ